MNSKKFDLGLWTFELNMFDVEKSTNMLAELACIFSNPISSFGDKIKESNFNAESLKKDFSIVLMPLLNSIEKLFTGYLKPSEVSPFLRRVLAEVRCKKKDLSGSQFVGLQEIYNEVFTGRIFDQFILAKEVLIFNYENEAERFFVYLQGFLGTAEEEKAQTSQATSTPKVAIQAR